MQFKKSIELLQARNISATRQDCQRVYWRCLKASQRGQYRPAPDPQEIANIIQVNTPGARNSRVLVQACGQSEPKPYTFKAK